MKELCWISVLGNLKILLLLASPLLAIGMIFFAAMYDEIKKERMSKKYKSFILRWLKIISCAFIFSVLGTIFIPTTSELYTIYGVGATIDYLKKNPEAKKLPDNLVNFLNRWLEDNEHN